MTALVSGTGRVMVGEQSEAVFIVDLLVLVVRRGGGITGPEWG